MRSRSLSVLVLVVIGGVAAASPSSAVGEDKPPPDQTAVEAVTKVFDARSVRSLDRSTFESVRRYFSTGLCRQIDKFLDALDRLNQRRDQVAQQAGIAESWWWPPEVDIDVHLLLKDDPLTNRAGVPDKLTMSEPRHIGKRIEILVTENYVGTAVDGTDLGGTKTCNVSCLPESDKWVIGEVTFTTQQYGRTSTTTLSQIVQQKENQTRKLEGRIKDFKRDIRPATPTSR
jgi:hypothetical protein